MKNVTLLSVKHAALLLIESNNFTTTLEVKNLLRDVGYFAEQDEISTFMEQAAQELPLEFTTSPSGYRLYELPSAPITSTDDDDDDDSTFAPITATSTDDDDDDLLSGISQDLQDAADVKYTSRWGEIVLMYDDSDAIADLGGVVTRKSTGAGKTFYFTQPIRRELARSAHASILGVHKNGIISSAVA